MMYVYQVHRHEHVKEISQQIQQQQMETHIQRHMIQRHENTYQKEHHGQRTEMYVDLHVQHDQHT